MHTHHYSSIDHQNYFQTSKGHVTWIKYRKLIEFLCIVVLHIRLSTCLLEVTWLECDVSHHPCPVLNLNIYSWFQDGSMIQEGVHFVSSPPPYKRLSFIPSPHQRVYGFLLPHNIYSSPIINDCSLKMWGFGDAEYKGDWPCVLSADRQYHPQIRMWTVSEIARHPCQVVSCKTNNNIHKIMSETFPGMNKVFHFYIF